MIDALIAGKMYGQPKQMTGKAGKPFAVAKVRTAVGDGDAMFVNVIAFDTDTVAALLALGDGDAAALAGSLTPKVWVDKSGTPKPVVDLVAHQVLTAYHVTRKRKAVQKSTNPSQRPEFDDDLGDI